MTKSACTPAEWRRYQRQFEVQRAACRLVIERGYDGFTMDDLAEAVGVSRRTLFNTVHDKESSVLGPGGVEEGPAITAFREAEPSDHVFDDVIELVAIVLNETENDDPEALECHRLVEQAMATDPKVLQLVNNRFAEVTAIAADAICERQDWPADDLRARSLATALLALIQLALTEFAAGDRPIGDAFQDVVTAFRSGIGLTPPTA
jgi:AcrR family transcriptional regulator